MTVVVAVANHKGGVGKTTTVSNLGAALTAAGREVLVVDVDPQASLTVRYRARGVAPSLLDVLLGRASAPEAVHASPRGPIIPSTLELAERELELVGLPGFDLRLQRALPAAAVDHDLVLLDCPPSLGHFTVAALAAADALLVPVVTDLISLEATVALQNTVSIVRQFYNSGLRHLGFLPTIHQAVSADSRAYLDQVRHRYGEAVFATVVPQAVDIKHDRPTPKTRQVWAKVAEELLVRCGAA